MVTLQDARQQGFTYLAMLLAIAVMGAMAAATGEVWSTAQQREKERDLLFAGNQIRDAIGLYYERSSGSANRYPKSLDDLLEDKRNASIQRYLRQIYVDPMTRTTDWGLILAPDGGIMGVHSRSEAHPVKVWGFSSKNEDFTGKSKYAEWAFVYKPATQILATAAMAIKH